MTLLESLAALIILGTTAVGFLEVFQTTARVTRDAGEWAQVTAFAESVMERTKLAETPADAITDAPPGVSARVETRPWAPGVRDIMVVVVSSGGRRLELHRLTREPPPGAPR
jgi:type II secretory pathway pseudopilin PulG